MVGGAVGGAAPAPAPPAHLPPSAEAAIASKGTLDASHSNELLVARNGAFERFRRAYRKNEAIEANKAQLKAKYEEAKAINQPTPTHSPPIPPPQALGERINATRDRINLLKGQAKFRTPISPTCNTPISRHRFIFFSDRVGTSRACHLPNLPNIPAGGWRLRRR